MSAALRPLVEDTQTHSRLIASRAGNHGVRKVSIEDIINKMLENLIIMVNGMCQIILIKVTKTGYRLDYGFVSWGGGKDRELGIIWKIPLMANFPPVGATQG